VLSINETVFRLQCHMCFVKKCCSIIVIHYKSNSKGKYPFICFKVLCLQYCTVFKCLIEAVFGGHLVNEAWLFLAVGFSFPSSIVLVHCICLSSKAPCMDVCLYVYTINTAKISFFCCSLLKLCCVGLPREVSGATAPHPYESYQKFWSMLWYTHVWMDVTDRNLFIIRLTCKRSFHNHMSVSQKLIILVRCVMWTSKCNETFLTGLASSSW